jgi:hypothetical protein
MFVVAANGAACISKMAAAGSPGSSCQHHHLGKLCLVLVCTPCCFAALPVALCVYCCRFLQDDVRPDGRGLSVCRPVSIARHAVGSADGSAVVKVCLPPWGGDQG